MTEQRPTLHDLNVTPEQFLLLKEMVAKAKRRRALPIYSDCERIIWSLVLADLSYRQRAKGNKRADQMREFMAVRRVMVAQLFRNLPEPKQPQSDGTARAVLTKLGAMPLDFKLPLSYRIIK